MEKVRYDFRVQKKNTIERAILGENQRDEPSLPVACGTFTPGSSRIEDIQNTADPP